MPVFYPRDRAVSKRPPYPLGERQQFYQPLRPQVLTPLLHQAFLPPVGKHEFVPSLLERDLFRIRAKHPILLGVPPLDRFRPIPLGR